jgi:hypothetical protein
MPPQLWHRRARAVRIDNNKGDIPIAIETIEDTSEEVSDWRIFQIRATGQLGDDA